MFLYVNYCSDMFRTQLLAIFRALASFSTCAAYVSNFVAEFLADMQHKLTHKLHMSKTCERPESGQQLREKNFGEIINK